VAQRARMETDFARGFPMMMDVCPTRLSALMISDHRAITLSGRWSLGRPK
jgi:hypothetical protein